MIIIRWPVFPIITRWSVKNSILRIPRNLPQIIKQLSVERLALHKSYP